LLVPVGLVMCSGSPASSVAVAGGDGGARQAGSGAAGSGNGSSGRDTGASGSSQSGAGGRAGASTGTADEAGLLGPGETPASCAASDVGNTPLGKDTPDATGTAAVAITYTNVGVAGSYDKVVTSTMAPTCVSNVCQKAAKAVSGPLVPFDEEMTMVFSGPMDLYQVAAYEPATGGAGEYERVAYWDRCVTDGLAFVGNKAWYSCGGYVQSYVTNDGTKDSPTPVQFAGHLEPGVGVNVMSSVLCTGTTDGSDCGFSLGLALHGFKGDAAGSKIFAAKFRMPIGNVTPAYWILPAQVVRSSQYGCNCRGEGGQGGCGELDVAEVLGGSTANPPHPMRATTTIYSFQGVTNGGDSYFQRPVEETATFVVIFDAPSRSIGLRRLGASDFSFATAIPAAVVSQWLANDGTSRKLP
jgi:hypothetical protein